MKELIAKLRSQSDWLDGTQVVIDLMDQAADALERFTSWDVALPDSVAISARDGKLYDEAQMLDYGARCRSDAIRRVKEMENYNMWTDEDELR